MSSKIFNDYASFAKSNGHVGNMSLHKYASFINSSRYINPTIIEERQLNIAQMDVFSRLIMDRIIFLGTPIDSDVSNIINSQLLYLESIGSDDIKLYINSPGGEVTSGLAIYDIMNSIKSHVSTFCMGLCASMGAVLLSSGKKGKRYSLPHGKVMIHQPLMNNVGGQASDIKILADEIEKDKNELYRILSNNTGQPFETIAEDADRDCWKTAEEAKEYGLVDNVIDKNV